MQKGKEILEYFHNDIRKALAGVFTESRTSKSVDLCGKISMLFILFTCNIEHFAAKNHRQKFFVDFAQRHGFDPFVADNWYSFPFDKLLHAKVTFPSLISFGNNTNHFIFLRVQGMFCTTITIIL
jgi:hypothetical protein